MIAIKIEFNGFLFIDYSFRDAFLPVKKETTLKEAVDKMVAAKVHRLCVVNDEVRKFMGYLRYFLVNLGILGLGGRYRYPIDDH
jgi:CBS domain-containing protein